MPPVDQPISSGHPLRVALGAVAFDSHGGRKALFDAILRAGCRPLDAVEEADVFVGVVGGEHFDAVAGTTAEGDYHRAVERNLPRLIFFAARAPDTGGAVGDFCRRLRAENACEPFATSAELAALVTQGLLEIRDGRLTGSEVPPGEPVVVTVVPPAPEFYAAPPYLLQGTRFVGRRAELAALNDWAASRESLMVVEAIGGMGKSALTWEWAQRMAPAAIPDLAGRVWWSFYERGTSMKTFLRHALAYVTGRPPNSFLKVHTTDLGEQLSAELRGRPFLLVLDGFERVLGAYHRSNKAQLRDDLVPTDARACTNPRDGDVLRQLLHSAPSRVLVSSRLKPAALEDHRTGNTLSGVRHLVLGGLAPADVFEMARAVGVRGTETNLLAFTDQFDRHPLLLRVACGLVADYPHRPGDFDAWRADPQAGGAIRLTDLVSKQRYTHLLEYAFRALGAPTRQLLSRIAVLSDAADHALVAALNPFLPPPPTPVPEPVDITPFPDQQLLNLSGLEGVAALEAERSEALVRDEHARRQYEQYLDAVRAYPRSPEYRKGMADFHAALTELEDRGLLQWDREANTYDMHPVVRAYAFELLEEGERVRAFSAIGDYFASRPREDPREATELSHLRNSVEIVRAFTGAGQGNRAADFLRGRLSEALLFTVGAHHALIELLTPLLGTTSRGAPLVAPERDRSYLMNNLALALASVGRLGEAQGLYTDAARLDLKIGDLLNLETGLRSLARCVQKSNQLHLAERILDLAGALAAATNDQHGITAGLLDRLALAATLGRLSAAEELFAAFHRRPPLPHHLYRPGAAEFHLAVARFQGGRLSGTDLARGEARSTDGRGVQNQHAFAALRAEWELGRGNAPAALEAVETALSIVRRTGESPTDYLGLRAHALVRAGLTGDAHSALAEAGRGWDGHLPRFPFHAAEAHLALGDTDGAREHLLEAYRCAWGNGPPYAHRYYLEQVRKHLTRLRIPEPVLPAFRAAATAPVPFEAELNEIIARHTRRRW
jgi:tetratricopeptide (TPR) repeat protein